MVEHLVNGNTVERIRLEHFGNQVLQIFRRCRNVVAYIGVSFVFAQRPAAPTKRRNAGAHHVQHGSQTPNVDCLAVRLFGIQFRGAKGEPVILVVDVAGLVGFVNTDLVGNQDVTLLKASQFQ